MLIIVIWNNFAITHKRHCNHTYFSFMQKHLKILAAKCWPFNLVLNASNGIITFLINKRLKINKCFLLGANELILQFMNQYIYSYRSLVVCYMKSYNFNHNEFTYEKTGQVCRIPKSLLIKRNLSKRICLYDHKMHPIFLLSMVGVMAEVNTTSTSNRVSLTSLARLSISGRKISGKWLNKKSLCSRTCMINIAVWFIIFYAAIWSILWSVIF